MVAVLFVAALVSYSDRLVLSVLVDPLRQDLDLTDSGVSLLQGPAFTLVYVFAALGFGRLADRTARKRLLVIGVSIWCLATVECGLARDFWTLLAGRILLGVGEATLLPTGISLIADSFPTHRLGTAVGVFAMGTVVGGPLGISAGGLLLEAATAGHFVGWPILGGLAPWRLVLVALGVIGLGVPPLLMTFREPLRRGKARTLTLRATVNHFVTDRRVLLPLYLGTGLLSLGDYGLVSWAPTTLSRVYGWPSGSVGVAFGVITAVAGVAGSLSGGWFSDLAERRGGTAARLRVALIAALPAALAALSFSGLGAEFVLVGLGVWVFASTIGGIGGIAALQEIVPAHFRGTAVSLLTFGNTLIGLGCGPPLIALTTEHLYHAPTAVGFAISTVVTPAALLASMSLGRTRRALAQARSEHR
jgi:MFS family permease